LASGLYERFGLTENHGNSENTTIKARLSAEAMSKAVSSMVAVLIGSDASFPNADHAVWMPTRFTRSRNQQRDWLEFGIIAT
jgi:hypothetical protein